MSSIRLLVGTRKGAFILTSDGQRQRWQVSGPHFAGWEMYHLKGSPVDPSRIYASQTSGWFGQIIQRSDDGGNDWEPLTRGLPQENCYVNILRDAMTTDTLDPCGVYFGTTGGQVYASADGGDSWSAVVRDHVTHQRRPFIRFYACEQDLSNEPIDTPLPPEVTSGAEPLLIIGAIAGG